MHMADALLSATVGVTMDVVSVGGLAYSMRKVTSEELGEKKLPVMAVAGAFVFAAQMINVTIPGTGSSGHIGGGILLAALLGAYPAYLTIAAVLVIQCLFFADGGLLALGCNLFNMGIVPCLIVYPLVFRPIVGKGLRASRLSAAAVLSSVLGLQLGAFCVVLETLASGITELPFGTFAALMQPIHLAIGLVEGVVTAAVLCFVYRVRPELLESAQERAAMGAGVSVRKVLVIFAVATVLVGGGLSLLASDDPDGLEWSVEKTAGTAELETTDQAALAAAAIQESTAILPDYAFASGDTPEALGTMTSGVVGAAVTCLLAGAVGVAVSAVKKRKKRTEPGADRPGRGNA